MASGLRWAEASPVKSGFLHLRTMYGKVSGFVLDVHLLSTVYSIVIVIQYIHVCYLLPFGYSYYLLTFKHLPTLTRIKTEKVSCSKSDTNKQTNKQTNKETKKQRNKETNKHLPCSWVNPRMLNVWKSRSYDV